MAIIIFNKYTMKGFIFLLLLIVSSSSRASAQVIDNTNYYEFPVKYGTTNWLRISDVVSIIIDELIQNGIEYNNINVGELFKVNDSTPLVACVAFRLKDKTYGFVYERRHSALLNVAERNFLNNDESKSYTQIQKGLNGESKWITVNPLPSNIFLLKQTVYWYQYGSKNNSFPVNRKVIEEILRQDIREYLKKV